MEPDQNQSGSLAGGMSAPSAIFSENEVQANHYSVLCLRYAALTAALMWLLNLVGFFIVDPTQMNVSMPIGICLMLLPSLFKKLRPFSAGVEKYVNMTCFILGLGVMSVALTFHLVLAWACPVVLSCHYYSPRFTRFTTAGALLVMSASFFAGIYCGVWDANVMLKWGELFGIGVRAEYIRTVLEEGENILRRGVSFFLMPRAAIIIVIHLISLTLSQRTHVLLQRQDEIVRESERVSAELNVATHIQTSMLPSIFPAFPEREEFDVFASMAPAREVGGDFYDFFMVDQRHLAVVMADVSGKGVPAALFMVIGKTLIKDHTQPGIPLGDVFFHVNNLLCNSNSEGMFITAFEGVLDLVTGELRFVNAGHEIPFIASGGQPFAEHRVKHSFVLAGMEGMRYQAGQLTLAPGDKLFQYTDGVTEATDAEMAMYGMDRLGAVLAANTGKAPTELLAAVKADIDAFVGGAPQADDITMLGLEYKKRMEESKQ